MLTADRLTSSTTTLSIIAEAALAAGLGNIRTHMPLSPGMTYRSRISHDQMTRLFMSMATECGGDGLGVRLAMEAPLRVFNVAVYGFLSSPTLGVGLQQWVKFQSIHTLASLMDITREGPLTRIRIDLADGALRTTRDQIEYYLVLLWRYMLWQTGNAITPVEVRLRGSPRKGSPYEQLFGCPVRFGQIEDAIILSREAWDAPSVHACPDAFEAMRQMADLQLTALDVHRLAAKVQLALRDLTEQNVAIDLAAVARRLNMSVRTVQRRLAAEGTSFQRVIDTHQAERAKRLLVESSLPIVRVADACGFVDRRSFYRAFQRWTGQTPAQYRRDAKGSPPAYH